MFIDISGGVTKTQKLGQTARTIYQIWRQDKQIAIIQCKKLIKRIMVDSFVLANRAPSVPPIQAESAPVMDIQKKSFGKNILIVPCNFGS